MRGASELGNCQMLPFLKSKRPSMCRRAFGEPGLYSYEARHLLAIAALCARIPLPALGDSFPDELKPWWYLGHMASQQLAWRWE